MRVLLYHEVRDDIVTGPLSEESHADNHGYSVSRSFRVIKLTEIPPRVFIAVLLPLFNDLAILKLDDRRIDIAVSVIFGKYLDRLFGAIVCDKPSGRLGEEKNEHHRDARKEALDQCRSSPCP